MPIPVRFLHLTEYATGWQGGADKPVGGLSSRQYRAEKKTFELPKKELQSIDSAAALPVGRIMVKIDPSPFLLSTVIFPFSSCM